MMKKISEDNKKEAYEILDKLVQENPMEAFLTLNDEDKQEVLDAWFNHYRVEMGMPPQPPRKKDQK